MAPTYRGSPCWAPLPLKVAVKRTLAQTTFLVSVPGELVAAVKRQSKTPEMRFNCFQPFSMSFWRCSECVACEETLESMKDFLYDQGPRGITSLAAVPWFLNEVL